MRNSVVEYTGRRPSRHQVPVARCRATWTRRRSDLSAIPRRDRRHRQKSSLSSTTDDVSQDNRLARANRSSPSFPNTRAPLVRRIRKRTREKEAAAARCVNRRKRQERGRKRSRKRAREEKNKVGANVLRITKRLSNNRAKTRRRGATTARKTFDENRRPAGRTKNT